ncbi:MAG: hypothetical protein ABSB95_05760 [Dissulfurispiraceae bacterium]|jgi:hypothetical protein
MKLKLLLCVFAIFAFSAVAAADELSQINTAHCNDYKLGSIDGMIKAGGFFALVEGSGDNNWILKKIDTAPLNRENTSQEILFINKAISYVAPNYSYFRAIINPYGMPRPLWRFDCNSEDMESQTYNPCNSKLMGRLMPIIGDYEIDRGKILDVIRQTQLIERIKERQDQIYAQEAQAQAELKEKAKEKQAQEARAAAECELMKHTAQEFLDKIKVFPLLSNKSGFDAPQSYSDLVNVTKKIMYGFHACDDKLEDLDFLIMLSKDNSDFELDIEPSRYHIKYSTDEYKVTPIITIKAKNFTEVYPQYSNQDKSLRVEFDRGKLWLTNKTDNFLQIKSISVYYNGEISGLKLGDTAIELPPQATRKEPLLIDTLASNDVKVQASYHVSKESAMTAKILFGFAIKYMVVEQNIDKTLFKQKTYNLYDVISKKTD